MSQELLRIEYTLDRTLWQNPDQDQLDVWNATLQIGRLSEQCETGIAWDVITTADLYGLDSERNLALGQAPFDVADAHSADAAYYYEHVFDVAGNLLPDVTHAFAWVSGRALFLHDVQVPPTSVAGATPASSPRMPSSRWLRPVPRSSPTRAPPTSTRGMRTT